METFAEFVQRKCFVFQGPLTREELLAWYAQHSVLPRPLLIPATEDRDGVILLPDELQLWLQKIQSASHADTPIGELLPERCLAWESQADDVVDHAEAGRHLIYQGESLIGYFLMIEEMDRNLSLPKSHDLSEKTGFQAHPRLDTPADIQAGQAFEVAVGFRPEADDTLISSGTLSVEDFGPEDRIEVRLLVSGAELIGPDTRALPLDAHTAVFFPCKAHEGVTQLSFTALYMFRHQHLGTATKQVNLDSETLEAVDTPPASFQVSRAVPEQTAIDLQLNIMRRDGETLQWSILAPSIGVNEGAISRLSEEQAQAAASRLAADFQQAGFDGPGPWNGLQNLGKMIRAAFPDRLEPIMHQVQEKLGDQALTLLLSTDEPFVPWELALLDQALLPENELLFLGNQTQMGRWWMHNQVPAQPPQALEIGQITALSGHYTLAARQVRLPEAEKEREHLVNTYQAIPLEADKATLDSLAKQGDTEPPKGHLMHIALHGFSDPRASSSGLFLTTGEVFPASFLVGGYRPGETPPIAFCFLNACQVGTENTFLGQASGFPGILLLNGAQGFLAPLWSVQDVLARELAEGFYEQALQEGKTLGEILQNLRDSYEIRGNLTPLAYVYYGHPGLKLTYSTP